jgi:hypothetical protein
VNVAAAKCVLGFLGCLGLLEGHLGLPLACGELSCKGILQLPVTFRVRERSESYFNQTLKLKTVVTVNGIAVS